jgi:hypothetical protein
LKYGFSLLLCYFINYVIVFRLKSLDTENAVIGSDREECAKLLADVLGVDRDILSGVDTRLVCDIRTTDQVEDKANIASLALGKPYKWQFAFPDNF